MIELKNIYILYVHLICWVGRDKRDFSHEPFLNSDRHMTNNQGTFLRQEEIKDPRNKVGSSFPWRDLITIFNKMFYLRHYGLKIFYDFLYVCKLTIKLCDTIQKFTAGITLPSTSGVSCWLWKINPYLKWTSYPPQMSS